MAPKDAALMATVVLLVRQYAHPEAARAPPPSEGEVLGH